MPTVPSLSPLEVPARFLNHSYTAGSERQSYYGMVACLDEGIRNVTEALKSYPNAWENTLFIFSADNGGETGGGGNNWPRRGGKYTHRALIHVAIYRVCNVFRFVCNRDVCK